ncbi:polyubiquitin, partial [Haematococcus lacustris]
MAHDMVAYHLHHCLTPVTGLWLVGKLAQLNCDTKDVTMRLLINCPSGQSRLLQVAGDATVLELKELLQDEEGIPVRQQVLCFAGLHMKDHLTLLDHKLEELTLSDEVRCTALTCQSPEEGQGGTAGWLAGDGAWTPPLLPLPLSTAAAE